MFTRFTPQARRTVVRAGLLSRDSGRAALDEDMILLALSEDWPGRSTGVTPEAVRAELAEPGAGPGERELLATLGIDLDEIRRRIPVRRDDPAVWRLRRSRLRPLNVTLVGPAGDIPLTPRARKVIEVAMSLGAPATREDLLKGMLADGSNRSVAILHRLGVDLPRLAGELGFLRRPA
ncbi:hypothetical protein HS041_36470 [Planomonospora sp. ID67723]|uniref:Clp protease N-terminal domain-containing protein n=1 Tax=Planomonospora sp. ID67723 TaxID=2738134 RepID=UPI0018C4412C|nr:Clp protease N-terminal domain-containing protein [Planomonospora sp. ID67723]MBG0833200.1 hypothetical protein [Planomonospora sp. ID67723]